MGTGFLHTIVNDNYDCPPTICEEGVMSTLVTDALVKTSFYNGYAKV